MFITSYYKPGTAYVACVLRTIRKYIITVETRITAALLFASVYLYI